MPVCTASPQHGQPRVENRFDQRARGQHQRPGRRWHHDEPRGLHRDARRQLLGLAAAGCTRRPAGRCAIRVVEDRAALGIRRSGGRARDVGPAKRAHRSPTASSARAAPSISPASGSPPVRRCGRRLVAIHMAGDGWRGLPLRLARRHARYRHLAYDFRSNRVASDIAFSGPAFAISFKFRRRTFQFSGGSS